MLINLKSDTATKLAKFFCIAFGVIALLFILMVHLQSPPPFPTISQYPQSEFLFLHIDDSDYTCLYDFCSCGVSEAPMIPFKFIDEKLVLNQSFFATRPSEWINFRKSNNGVVLYSYWSQWYGYLKSFSSFPINTEGDFSILGVNKQGDIQVKIQNRYVILLVGSKYKYEFPQWQGFGCKVLRSYTLHNYGFIKDNNVEFLYKE